MDYSRYDQFIYQPATQAALGILFRAHRLSVDDEGAMLPDPLTIGTTVAYLRWLLSMERATQYVPQVTTERSR
jgi:hypothetical protein